MDKMPTTPESESTAAPVATLYETAIKPTLTIVPNNPVFAKGLTTVINNTQNLAAFGKANLEAVAASGQIWVAGVQDLAKQIVSTANASFEESVATVKAMSTAKSIREAIELQSTRGQAVVAKAVAESKALADASVKLIEQAVAPLKARMTDAVESLGKAA